jgi:hypothetical protein
MRKYVLVRLLDMVSKLTLPYGSKYWTSGKAEE